MSRPSWFRTRTPLRRAAYDGDVRNQARDVNFAELFAGGLAQRQFLKLDKLLSFAAVDDQRGRSLTAGEVERTAFFAVEASGFSGIKNEANARRRARRSRFRIGLFVDHQHDDAFLGLFHEVAAGGLRAEIIADAINRPVPDFIHELGRGLSKSR